MVCFIKDVWNRINYFILKSEEETEIISDDELIRQALDEINQAWNLFSEVEDHDLIDYAIYSLNAAEIKYNYLVKRLKRKEDVGNLSVKRRIYQ